MKGVADGVPDGLRFEYLVAFPHGLQLVFVLPHTCNTSHNSDNNANDNNSRGDGGGGGTHNTSYSISENSKSYDEKKKQNMKQNNTNSNNNDNNNKIIIIKIIKKNLKIITFKGAIRICLQSPQSAASHLQHVRSSGPGAIACTSRARHRALITCNMSCYVPCGTKRQLSY